MSDLASAPASASNPSQPPVAPVPPVPAPAAGGLSFLPNAGTFPADADEAPRSVAEAAMPSWEMNVILTLALWFSAVSLADGDPMLWVPALIVLGVSVYSVLRTSGTRTMLAGLIAAAAVMVGLTYGAAMTML